MVAASTAVSVWSQLEKHPSHDIDEQPPSFVSSLLQFGQWMIIRFSYALTNGSGHTHWCVACSLASKTSRSSAERKFRTFRGCKSLLQPDIGQCTALLSDKVLLKSSSAAHHCFVQGLQ
jgi:hypothetical protein